MISILLATLALGQQSGSSQPDGAAIISKMFAYYATATSMTGTIKMTQTAQNIKVSVDTTLAFEAPNKLFLKQVLHGSRTRTWLVTSDGKSFSYDFPNDQRLGADKVEPSRMIEPVVGLNGAQNYQDIFHVAFRSLGDLSIPELLAIGGTNDFRTIKSMIATIDSVNGATVDGTPVSVLRGSWRSAPQQPPSATYEMDVAADGQLKRYAQIEVVSVPAAKINAQQILTVWDVALNLNAKPDESLFTLVTKPID